MIWSKKIDARLAVDAPSVQRSADDLKALLAAIDSDGALRGARDAEAAATKVRDDAQLRFDGALASSTLKARIATGEFDQIRRDLRAAEAALAAAEEARRAAEAIVVARASSIVEPACRAAAAQIAQAITEIAATFATIETAKRDAGLRRLPPTLMMQRLYKLDLLPVTMFGQRLAEAVGPQKSQ